MTGRGSSLLAISLGIGCVALGWLIYVESTTPIEVPPLAPPPTAAKPRIAKNTVAEMPPISAFGEIIARPVFSKTRRPEIIAKPANPEKPAEINIMLTGIIIGQTQKIAHLKEYKKTKVQELREGDTISEWRVEKILEDRVIIRAGQQTESLFLQASKPAPTRANTSRAPRGSRNRTRGGMKTERRPPAGQIR